MNWHSMELTSETSGSYARITLLDEDSHPVHISLGRGAEMGTQLTVREARNLRDAINLAIEQAIINEHKDRP